MERTVFFIGQVRLEVKQGDITGEEVDAVVNAANSGLKMGGGVAAALKRKGGEEIEREALGKGPVPVGEAVVTSAGKLPAKHVIHAAVMGMDFATDAEKIRRAARNSFLKAVESGFSSLAFPALGCGTGRFPPEKAAQIMFEEAAAFFYSPLKDVRFVLFDAGTYAKFAAAAEKHLAGLAAKTFRNPLPTVDVILRYGGGVVLVRRKNPPPGWAIPGGFVEYGESLEEAALREIKEETGLEVAELEQFHAYSAPGRDPRFHTVTLVFTGRGVGTPQAADDAAETGVFDEKNLPAEIAFDHRRVLLEYFHKEVNKL